MSMNINASYRQPKADYAGQLEERQPLEKAKKLEERQNQAFAPQDEYISSKKSGEGPSGLYRVGKGEDGSPKVFYDGPRRPAEEEGAGKPGVNADNPGKPTEECTGDTNQVDREIKELKEKKQQLERQVQLASGDGEKVKELQRKLAQVEMELSQKDNDTYRRQHTIFR